MALSLPQDTLRPMSPLGRTGQTEEAKQLYLLFRMLSDYYHPLEGLDRKRKQNCVKWLYLFLRTLSDHCHPLEGLDRQRKQNGSISSSGHSQTMACIGRTGQKMEENCIKWLCLLLRTLRLSLIHI